MATLQGADLTADMRYEICPGKWANVVRDMHGQKRRGVFVQVRQTGRNLYVEVLPWHVRDFSAAIDKKSIVRATVTWRHRIGTWVCTIYNVPHAHARLSGEPYIESYHSDPRSAVSHAHYWVRRAASKPPKRWQTEVSPQKGDLQSVYPSNFRFDMEKKWEQQYWRDVEAEHWNSVETEYWEDEADLDFA